MIKSLLLGALLTLAATMPPHQSREHVERRTDALPAAPAVEPERIRGDEAPVVTRHAILLNGRKLSYTATAGFLPVLNDAGEVEARIFFVAYTADTPDAGRPRPLAFAFNGGPGSSAVWLHLGLGPKRVRMLPDGAMPSPPFAIEDNASTWLDAADLVFVDPVGTGYSRAVKPEQTSRFTTVSGDIDSLSRFVRFYLTRFDRWKSPLFLIGESYGTFRTAGLTEPLLERGVALNGIVLISAVLNMQTQAFDHGNDLPYVSYLPSYAATAWYHGRAGKSKALREFVSEAEQWSEKDFRLLLARGDLLPPAEKKAAAATLAAFTGLSPALIESRNLRIDNVTFARELLRDDGKSVGFLDSRFTAVNPVPASLWPGFDATIAAIRPPFTATFNDYVRQELGFRTDVEYYVLGEGIGKWNWETGSGYADTSDNLRNALARNPYMKVLVCCGFFDLSTPEWGTDYTLRHLGLPLSLHGNFRRSYFETGHMMYLDERALPKLRKDFGDFLTEALPH